MLQQQFNEHVFVLEQKVYEAEGLDFTSIPFKNNQHIIDLISSKPSGLLIILEEHGMLNRKPDNRALLQTFHNTHYSANESYDKPRFAGDEFIVKHFAGEVTYDISGFIEKNNDSLQEDLMQLLLTSTDPFIQNVINIRPVPDGPGFIPVDATTLHRMASDENVTEEELKTTRGRRSVASRVDIAKRLLDTKGGSKTSKFASRITVSSQFRGQLVDLGKTLRATEPHYVKCIKPNPVKTAGAFSNKLVMEQLRYSGVLEVVRIRREAFPTRVGFLDFYRTFEILAYGKGFRPVQDFEGLGLEDIGILPSLIVGKREEEEEKKKDDTGDEQQQEEEDGGGDDGDTDVCHQENLQELKDIVDKIAGESLPEGHHAIGKTQLFLRDQGLNLMRSAVCYFYDLRAAKIQAMARGRRTLMHYKKLQKSTLYAQTLVRMFIHKMRFRKTVNAIRTIQSFYLSKLYRRKFESYQAASIIVQKYTRRMLAQNKFTREGRVRVLATFCQALVRGFLARKFRDQMLAARTIQAVIRRNQQKERYLQDVSMARRAVTHVARFVRGWKARSWFKMEVRKVVLVQAGVRAWKARRVHMSLQTLERLRKERENKKAIILQSYARMWPQRAYFKHLKVCASKIQSLFRMKIAWNRFMNTVRLAIHMQSLARMRREQINFQYHRDCAAKSQSLIRKYLVRSEFLKKKSACMRLQVTARRYIRNKSFWERLLLLHKNANEGRGTMLKDHLDIYPQDRYVRNKWRGYCTLLHSAILSGDASCVRWLNPKESDLMAMDIEGNGIFHFAARVSSLKMLKWFASRMHQLMEQEVGVLRKSTMTSPTSYGDGRTSSYDMRSTSPTSNDEDDDHYDLAIRNRQAKKQMKKMSKRSSMTEFGNLGINFNEVLSESKDSSLGESKDDLHIDTSSPGDISTTGSLALYKQISSKGGFTTMAQMNARRSTASGQSLQHASKEAQKELENVVEEEEEEDDDEDDDSDDESTPSATKGTKKKGGGGGGGWFSRMMGTALEPDDEVGDDEEVLFEGFLEKRKENYYWQKRWAILTDKFLRYYKKKSDKKPRRVVRLDGAMMKKSEKIERAFEIHSPHLIDKKNPEGRLYFKLASEVVLQQWLIPLRFVTHSSHTTVFSSIHFTYTDLGLRAEMISRKNKLGRTPLHILAMYGAVATGKGNTNRQSRSASNRMSTHLAISPLELIKQASSQNSDSTSSPLSILTPSNNSNKGEMVKYTDSIDPSKRVPMAKVLFFRI